MKVNIQESKEETAKAFAEYLAERINNSQSFHLALSGGSTPKAVFDLLAAEYANIIDWSKVFFYWGDERCVLPTDSESNYNMTNSHLLSKIGISERQVFRIQGENEPSLEARRYAQLLEDKLKPGFGIPQFDMVILGMGDDGHTASIFPFQINLWDARENCIVAAHPETGQKRISITGKIINNAAEVAFLVTGKNKADKVTQIINKTGDYIQYPAALVAPRSSNLVWFMDKDAATYL
ncbi:6-phosphogluconolactonase [Eudoraea chungangensis]|uniref:6-phosphogluconolactonase n=1 Tax=Eudoraea chungangensis TaxID=1481905 RepID=UPI0023EB5E97|nr:6-phosphogluconolactonase [Eudoraea chungangensis]